MCGTRGKRNRWNVQIIINIINMTVERMLEYLVISDMMNRSNNRNYLFLEQRFKSLTDEFVKEYKLPDIKTS